MIVVDDDGGDGGGEDGHHWIDLSLNILKAMKDQSSLNSESQEGKSNSPRVVFFLIEFDSLLKSDMIILKKNKIRIILWLQSSINDPYEKKKEINKQLSLILNIVKIFSPKITKSSANC